MLRAHRRGSGEELLLLLRHKVRYEEWEGLDDDARDVEVARSMRGEAERERATVRRLAGCKAWAPLDHELGAAAVARVGPSGAYPCVVLEAGRGKLLHELLPLDGCGGDADADGGKGGGGLPSPAQLDAHLSVIREAALGAMHAVAQAWELGPRTRYGHGVRSVFTCSSSQFVLHVLSKPTVVHGERPRPRLPFLTSPLHQPTPS